MRQVVVAGDRLCRAGTRTGCEPGPGGSTCRKAKGLNEVDLPGTPRLEGVGSDAGLVRLTSLELGRAVE